MKALGLLTLTAALLIATLALARPAEDAKGMAEKLQGTWTVVAGERGGKKEPEERIQGTTARFSKDEIHVTDKDANETYLAKYKLQLTHKPYQIKMTAQNGPDKGKTAQGIFQLEGDTLKLCYALPGAKAPSDFTTRPGSKHMLFVMKRAK